MASGFRSLAAPNTLNLRVVEPNLAIFHLIMSAAGSSSSGDECDKLNGHAGFRSLFQENWGQRRVGSALNRWLRTNFADDRGALVVGLEIEVQGMKALPRDGNAL